MPSGKPSAPPWERRPGLLRQRFNTVQGRWQHRQELDAHLQQWTVTHEAQALMHLLQVHGVPAGVVQYRARSGG